MKLAVKLHYGNPWIVKLIFKPHHMDSYIRMSRWMVGFTNGTNES